MYVCICNAFTERQVRSVLTAHGPCTTARVYRCLGGTPQCGKCVSHVREMIVRHQAVPPASDSTSLPG